MNVQAVVSRAASDDSASIVVTWVGPNGFGRGQTTWYRSEREARERLRFVRRAIVAVECCWPVDKRPTHGRIPMVSHNP